MLDYGRITPIRNTLAENKQQAKRYYGKHQYFTTRAWNVVQSYITNFSQEGDLVLDPFGGSGVTAIEALVLKRNAIHLDISPLSIFLTEATAISPVNLTQLGEAFSRIRQKCEIIINQWFKMDERDVQEIPISYWYPLNIALPMNADVNYVHELFTPKQLISLAFLYDTINQEGNETIRKMLLLTFSATLIKTNRTFLSAAGRKESRGGAAIFSQYRYYVPANPVELNVWEQFKLRFDGILKAKQETNLLIGEYYNSQHFRAINGSATQLTKYIDVESVDYIFTDPPYGAHIAYLDLSTMWHAWLQLPVTEEHKALEAIEGEIMVKQRTITLI
jgi:16S rRNA G966 N2-methylase RsmD